MNARFAIALLTVGSIVGAACGSSDTSSTTVPSTTPATTATTTSTTRPGAELGSRFEGAIEALRIQGDIPSLGAGIVIDDELVWARGFGDQPSTDTVYMAGSIDKAFFATAVMQLVEQGLIDLDADVGDYLPFPVRNPEYPETVVTSRMLLTHQAGLANTFPDSTYYDNDEKALEWAAENLDFDLSTSPYLEGRPSHAEYVESHFLPGGKNAGDEIWIDEPGARMLYSNLGLAHLVPYLIEEVSGEAWADYIDGHILEPLGMTETSFDASDFAETRLAVPHTRVEGEFLALPITGMNASGKLRTTVPDLARFLAAHMNAGRLNDAVILQSGSVAIMHEEHLNLRGDDWGELTLDGEGLGWWLWLPDLEGHGGHVPGYSARMMMSERDAGAYGIVLMLNVGCSLQCDEDWYNDHVVAIRELLLEEAAAQYAARAAE